MTVETAPDPSIPAGSRYRFGDVVVDAGAHTLTRAGEPRPVEPKAFAALLVLLHHPGQLVTRDDLMDAVWGHRHVTPGVLTRVIAQLREALGDDAHQPRYIQTRHAVGYLFIGELIDETPDTATVPDTPVTPEHAEPAPTEHESVPHPHEHHWRWSWLAAGLLVVVLGVMAWLDQRAARTTDAAKPADASIAVLPFTTLSDDKKDAYYAEGLATEMHDALSGVQGLKVAALVSPAFVARYQQDVKSLGQKLGVATVLDASVRRDGERVRINARLSDTATGYTLWSHSYDRPLADVFATQTEIADEVLGSLLQVLPQQRQAVAKRLVPTQNLAAFDDYLRGIYLLVAPGKDDGSSDATDSFRRALAQDPKFARAQAGICRAEVSNFINRHDAGAFDRAKTACERARAMDATMSEVSLALGDLYAAKGERGEAIRYYSQAAADPPRQVAAFVGIAIAQSEAGHPQQAKEYFDRALALDPHNGRIHAQIGYQQYLAGKYPEAIASYRKAVELLPDDAEMWGYLAGVYLTAGQMAEAQRALERSMAIHPSYTALSNLGEIAYLSGRYAEAVDLQRRALQLDASDHDVWGGLGEALDAVGSDPTHAKDAYRQAADRAQRYVDMRPEDAKAVAILGWYRACLGQSDTARKLILRAEALGGEPGEVALYGALAYARMGDVAEARKHIAAARAGGVAEYRINGNPALHSVL